MLRPSADFESTELVVPLTLRGCDRWQAYRRLQALDRSCECAMNQPLQIHCRYPLDILQSWSVARSLTQSRSTLIQALENCLDLPLETPITHHEQV